MKTRTIKELLILLRDYFPKSFEDGRDALCFAIKDMYRNNHTITAYEAKKLHKYIHEHKPEKTYNKAYFFEEGKLAPRMKFLDKLIYEL